MKDLAIIGAGGFGKEVKALVNQINQRQPTWNLLGFYDDQPLEEIQGLPIIGSIVDLLNQSQKPSLIVAIGNSKTRFQIVTHLSTTEIAFATLIHPSVIIGDPKTVDIASGSIITAGVILTTDIEIGKHVIINLNTTVGHDARIGDYCSIMPGTNLAGNVRLEKGAFVGAGANILGDVNLGAFSTIGAGAVVTSDIPTNAIAVGVPAKVLKDA